MSLSGQWSPTSVQVTVLQARGLRIKGKHGTNDAYAVMQLGKEKYQTSVAEKSVAPVWKEEASFDMPAAHQGGTERGTLHVHVLHRALVGPDKLLGQAVINLLQLNEDKSRDKTQWFKLLDKSGKPDKDRGELLVDIQFTRNNMTASMFDISAAGKSRSRLGKFKDKVKGKKKEDNLSETSSTVMPPFSQVMTDSEGEGDSGGEGAAAGKEQKKKGKVKSLFSHKTNLQKSLSQSMSVLPGKNSSLSGSLSSGLNVEASEGKKKFKFLGHKRTASSDKKEQKLAADQSNLCINGSHVYCEESSRRTSRASSNFSLASSGVGSMEDVPDSSPPSVGSRSSVRHSSPWTKEEEEETIEENTQQVDEEMFRRQELEKCRMEEKEWMSEEEERRQREEEEKRMDEEKRIEHEKMRVEQERLQKEEEEKQAAEMMRAEEERKTREEEERIEEQRKIEEEQMRREEKEKERVRREEERIRLEYEQKRREEEEEEEKQRQAAEEEMRREVERKAVERRRQEEREEELRKLEEERATKERLVEEESKRQEEQERREEELRIEREREEERRVEEARKLEEEERQRREEEEKISLERERERLREEKERSRKEREEQRRLEEEEKRQYELQQEQERIRQEEEKMRLEKEKVEEEMKKKRKEEEEKRAREEQEKRAREEQENERMRAEQRKLEEEELRRQTEEEELRRKMEEEELRRKMEEEELRRKMEEEEMRRKMEEDERQKREEALEKDRLAEEDRRQEKVKRRREEEARVRAENVQRHSKTAPDTHDCTSLISTNPFDESDEDDLHEENVPESTGSVTSARQRCKLPVERNTCSSSDVRTALEKRPAPKPPRINSLGRQQAPRHDAQVNEQSKDKKIKTASVQPQRAVQKTHVSSHKSSNNQHEYFPGTARSSGRRPAPQRPSLTEEEHLSPKDPLLKSKQTPAVSNSNPFEDSEDMDELADTSAPVSVMQQPPVEQNVEKNAVSSIKIKSSKAAHAPAPPAITTNAPSIDTCNEMATSDINEKKDPAPVQEASPKESPQAVQEEALKDAPLVSSRRLQSVRPLNTPDQKPVSSIQEERDEKSNGKINCRGKENVKDAGPYALLTQEELISLVLKKESLLSEKSKKISELEQYIDNLLVRVIEEAPNVLMTITPLK